MARLSSASKKAASTVASKIGNNGSSPTPSTNAVANSSAIANSQTIAVLDWVQYSLSPSQTRYLNENQMKAGEKIRAKIGLLGRLNIK
jgi:hypothetical protein